MTDWTHGYVADIAYTYGYYGEMNPARAQYCLLDRGLGAAPSGPACELGFGQGISCNIHAAAGGSEWWGTDFNPEQAAFAQQLVQASGASAKFFDQSFEEFCSRPDLPDFAFISLHGIWSWISDENRQIIVDFVRRKLKVGGVLYISYNTQPGWASFVPMRDLFTQYVDAMSPPGAVSTSKVDQALAFAERLMATKPAYAAANPKIEERLQQLQKMGRNYLAHEYFNRDWVPMSFDKMSGWLAPAKLAYGASANLLDYVEAINVSAEQKALLDELGDVSLRETVRDFLINQQFRRDYWVKGGRRLTGIQQVDAIRQLRVLLPGAPEDVVRKVTGVRGEAELNQSVYEPILAAMSDRRVRTVGELESLVLGRGVGYAQLVQALQILVGKGSLVLVQEEKLIKSAQTRTRKLNSYLLQLSAEGTVTNYLASPVSGGGIVVERFDQYFLLALQNGRKQPADQAAFAWAILQRTRQLMVKEGKTLETAEENLKELESRAVAFAKTLPGLAAMGIA